MLSNYIGLKKDKQYLKVMVANIISDFGNSIDNIAFSWLVYEITGDPVWIAIIFGSAVLPMIFLQPVFAVWVERFSKKKVILFADAAGLCLMVTMGILYMMDVLTPMMLLLFTIINACIESIRIPAGLAFIPKILSKENYVAGTALSRSACQLSSLIGLAATGFILGFWGIHMALFVDAITFGFSFLIIAMVKYKEDLTSKLDAPKLDIKQFKVEYKEGFAYLRSKKGVFTVCICGVLCNFVTQ